MTTDKQQRKQTPLYSGLLTYFPDALAAVANLSYVGNQQHNPGEPLHWDRTKSTDHADCLLRHLSEAGVIDNDGISHTTKVAWRALALLQVEIETQRAEAEAEQFAQGLWDTAYDSVAVGVDTAGSSADPFEYSYHHAKPGQAVEVPADTLTTILERSPVIDHRNDQTACEACARKLAEIESKNEAANLPVALDNFKVGDNIYSYTANNGVCYLTLTDRVWHQPPVGYAIEPINAGDRVRLLENPDHSRLPTAEPSR